MRFTMRFCGTRAGAYSNCGAPDPPSPPPTHACALPNASPPRLLPSPWLPWAVVTLQQLSPRGRNNEERVMLEDARGWYNSGVFGDVPHYKTGATALHVAATKGYIKVMHLLLQAGGEVNCQVSTGFI